MPLIVGSVAAPVIGGFIGQNAGQGSLNAANDARQAALQQYLGINVPSIASQQLNLQQYQNAGNLTPQMEQALQQGPNALGGIKTDPRLVQAQMAALNQLSTTGQMGMTPGEHAALVQAQNNAAAQAQAKSGQILNQFAARGMGGSGAELAAQLSNSQNAAQMLANNSNQVAQSAQQQALEAMSRAGQLGSQMQGQQFGQQAQVAQAQNLINQFNTQNSQAVQNQNVNASNQAALRNLLNNQNLMNQNTGLSNQQQQYNKQLLQQQFNNQMARASGAAGQYGSIADANQQQAGNIADSWAGIGKGVGTGLGTMYASGAFNGGGGNSLENEFDKMPGTYDTQKMRADNSDYSNQA